MRIKFLLALLVLVIGIMGLVVYANDDGDDNDNDNGSEYGDQAIEAIIADPVDITGYFTDEVLKRAILVLLTDDEDYPVTEIYNTDVAGIDGLLFAGLEIESLDGIEHFIALTWLDISGNYLTELYLPYNIALTRINASNNNITEVDLRENVNLEHVDLSDNEELATIDLRANINLQHVDLRGTDVTDPRLPMYLEPHEDYPLLFVLPEEEEEDEPEPYDGILDDRGRLLDVIYDEIDWREFDRIDDFSHTVYLSVTFTYQDPNWRVISADVFDAQDFEDVQGPGALVRIFSWVLVLAALLSFILSMVLFILRKE